MSSISWSGDSSAIRRVSVPASCFRISSGSFVRYRTRLPALSAKLDIERGVPRSWRYDDAMRGCLSGPSARQARTSAGHRILLCRRGLLLALAACANEPSRLDGLGSTPTPAPPAPPDAALRDEADRDLERRLR